MFMMFCRTPLRRLSLAAGALLAGAALGGCDGRTAAAPVSEVSASVDIKAQALPPTQAQAATWAAPVSLTLVPAAGAVMSNGKVMLWAADGRRGFATTGQGHTYTTLFDPATNTAVERNVTNTGHDMFCPGTARLPDGRLLVNGGLDSADTSVYDPATDTWSVAAPMNIGRGYNTSTTLGDGSVLTLGGSWSGTSLGLRTAEIYTAQGGWRLLSGLPEDPFRIHNPYGSWQDDSHMTLMPTANGKVLLVGPTVNMAWIDPTATGSWTPAGVRGDDTTALGELTVMYDAGKIFKTGGATWNAGAPASAASYLIDTTGGTAVVKKTTSMAYPRMYGNVVALPNGQVMLIGGQTYVQEFSDSNAVLAPELFDPVTETFTVLPAMTVPRTYHSIAMLLPDARILAAGGGVCGCAADHTDLQIMAPPYLFNADGSPAARPKILSAPASLAYGATVAVSTDSAVTAFSLVHLGATTHTVDNDQRRLPLSVASQAGNTYQLNVPTNPGLLLPGQWMLFAMNAQGTPSVAAIVTVGSTGVPVLQNPGTQNLKVGQSLYLTLSGTSALPLTWSSPSLPAGLSISSSGALSGAPTATGNSVISVRASNGTQAVSTDFLLSVTDDGTGTGLTGQYFAGTGLPNPALLTRIEAPYFDWGTAAPAAGVPADQFSVRWSGTIEAVATGITTLSTYTDDGVRIWVDGQLVIDNWANHSNVTNSAALTWVANRRYPIVVEYYDNVGPATFHLSWQPPGASALVPVPAAHLYPATLPSATNLALGAIATQSSTATGGEASRAVDGNLDGNFANGSVAATTAAATQDWWQVDLRTQSRIDTVQLWNRSDCCAGNLMNFAVFVSPNDMTGRTFDQLRADPAVIMRSVLKNTNAVPDISIPVGGIGRYVRVQMAAQKALSLAEVQVWGGGGASYHTPTLALIADQQTAAGSAVSLTVSGVDPDGNPLTYQAAGLPPGLSIATASGLISGTAGTAGSYAVTVTATNAGNLSASRSFSWTVTGTPPTVTAIPAPVAASGSAVTYTPVISNGGGATYSWNFGDGTAATAASSTATVSHTFANPGVYTVTLLMQSGGQGSTQSFMQAISAPGATAPARASSNLVLEPRSGLPARLWVVNQDNDSVSVFDTSNGTRLAEIAVGSAPRSVARGADGTIWVTNKVSATLSAISPASLTVTGTLPLARASQPFGVLVSPTDGSLFVALEATGQVLKLNSTGTVQGTVTIGNAPRHLAMNAAGTQLLVSRFLTRPMPGEGTAAVSFTDASGNALGGELVAVNPATMTILRTLTLANSTRADTENQGRGIPNYLGAAAISPDGKSAWVPSKQDDIQRGTLRDGNALTFQNTVRSVSSRLDLTTNKEDLAGRVDHDNAGLASAALYHPNGVYVFVALETNRQVAVIDAAGKRELFRYEVGLAPEGLALSADGLSLYVNNFMDRTVGVLDLRPLLNFGQISAVTPLTWNAIGTERLAAAVLKGKQLFYDARDPRLARDSYLACAVCHDDGGLDGRTWDFTSQGEGLRNTIALRGRAGMAEGFLHWSANFDEVQDFEGQIRTLAGGTGLMSDAAFATGTRSQPLGDGKAGVSADLDALGAYLASLSTFNASPFRATDGTLTAAALAGKTVFLKNSCAGCHGGAGFTLSADGSQLKNIGTLKTSSGSRNGGALPGIDIPTLRDVWATAPYLHDGSAATIANAITAHSGISLSAADLANVAAYVQQIGGEEPPSPGVFCTAERTTCTLPAGATATVSFGAGNTFNVKSGITGSIACSTATFGDPAPGAAKACYYVITSQGSVGTGTGLSGSYFATKDLTGAVVVARTEAVNFNWGSAAPGPGLPATNWSARWSGAIEAPATGSYQLQTNSDDVIRVWVNGVQVINNWVSHAPALNTSALLAFTAGQKSTITIEYAQYAGGAVAQLLWLKPGDAAFNAVPADRLYPQ